MAPIPLLERDYPANNRIMTLLTKARARLSMMTQYVEDFQVQIQRQDQGLIYRLSEQDVKTVMLVDQAVQFDSDENLMAVFKHASTHQLRHVSNVLFPVDTPRSSLEDAMNAQLARNPLEADFALALLGYTTGAAFAKGFAGSSQQHRLCRWVAMLQAAGAELSVRTRLFWILGFTNDMIQELRRRSAAAFSLKGFFDALSENTWHSFGDPKLIDVYMALHDTLVDDDEDVRYQGAATVSLLPSAIETDLYDRQCSNHSLSPPAAKSKLLQFLRESYPTSRTLQFRAVEILTGLQLSSSDIAVINDCNGAGAISLRPIKEILADAQKPQLAVFVEEKQNLYIDLVEEAEVWAGLMTGLNHDVRDDKLVGALELWTMDGLSYLLELCKTTSDKPSGWASNPETFTIFVRVILATKVVFVHSKAQSTNGETAEIIHKKHLEELLALAKSSRLHSLLVDRLENIVMELQEV